MIQVSDGRARAFAAATVGEAVALEFHRIYDLADSLWGVPAYRFQILSDGARAGTISLRIGLTDLVVRFAGQLGFVVDPPFRGRGFAEQATRLLLPLASAHGLQPLWLTCNPANVASRRTPERLGAVYVETVALPEDYDTYAQGEREKCLFRLDLG